MRLPPLNLQAQHAAPCSCPAGQRIRLKSGYKTWGYMRDSGPAGQDETRPAPAVVSRARARSGPCRGFTSEHDEVTQRHDEP